MQDGNGSMDLSPLPAMNMGADDASAEPGFTFADAGFLGQFPEGFHCLSQVFRSPENVSPTQEWQGMPDPSAATSSGYPANGAFLFAPGGDAFPDAGRNALNDVGGTDDSDNEEDQR